MAIRAFMLAGNNRIVPAFTIIQHKESKVLLCAIQSYFKCGALYEIKPNYVRFVVEVLSSLINIPHFERYPLHTIKREKCRLLREKQHHFESGRKTLLALIKNMKNTAELCNSSTI
jgi:hypothetical protein